MVSIVDTDVLESLYKVDTRSFLCRKTAVVHPDPFID